MIANDDLFQLKLALNKKFRPHTEIIKRITSRTKSQIVRIGTLNDGSVLKNVFKLSDKYGNFLKCCFKSHSEVTTVLIKTACAGLGCDYAALINIICSSTPSELISLDKELANELGLDNLKKVAVGNAQGPLMQKFFDLAMVNLERRDSAEYNANDNVANDEVAILQTCFGDAVSDVNDDKVLNILVKASRAHTVVISDAFKAAAGIELETAIKQYFGNHSHIAMALISWISPVARAVARMLAAFSRKVPTNDGAFELIYGVLSRHDKPMLAQISKEYTRIATEDSEIPSDLNKLIVSCMRGKLAQAVTLWCNADITTPDMGVEEELVQYLATKALHDGTDCDINVNQIAGLIKDTTTASEIKEILEREVFHLKAYQSSSIKKGDIGEVDQEGDDDSLTPEQETRFRNTCALLAGYFKVLFAYYDKDQSGLLDNTEFWRMVDEVNLTEFGFADDDIARMKEVSDWDSEGKGIAYDEVISELSLQIFKSCVKLGINEEELIKVRIEAHASKIQADHDAEAADVDAAAIRQNKLHGRPKEMPPHIETWIHATFNAYDVDKSGELDHGEFLNCINY